MKTRMSFRPFHQIDAVLLFMLAGAVCPSLNQYHASVLPTPPYFPTASWSGWEMARAYRVGSAISTWPSK